MITWRFAFIIPDYDLVYRGTAHLHRERSRRRYPEA